MVIVAEVEEYDGNKPEPFRIIGINSGLILLGVGGLVQSATSALVHNASTLAISLSSMKNLFD